MMKNNETRNYISRKKMNRISIVLIALFLLTGFSLPEPKVLIIGDSISIGYFPYIKDQLSDVAVLKHNRGNAEYTGYGLENIRQWIGNEKWDVIQFNWGLWDLAYRMGEGRNRKGLNKKNGTLTTTPAAYARNLDSLLKILRETHAKLIFVTTTYVPGNEPGRYTKDVKRYNKIAKRIMRANGVLINDIYAKSKKIHQKYGLGDKNVHYTKEGYKHLAKYVGGFLRKEL